MVTTAKTKSDIQRTRAEQGNRETVTRRVVLEGITPILFDRYPGDNDTKLTASQKLYLSARDGATLIMPSVNVMSFLSAKNTDSAPKRLLDSRKYKKFTEACAAFVMIERDSEEYDEELPITRNGDPLVFTGFDKNDKCESTGMIIRRDVARLEKGIPNPKERPLLGLAWEITFRLTLYVNDQLQEQQLKNVFEKGGIAVGLGTWRGRYGKFRVSSWD